MTNRVYGFALMAILFGFVSCATTVTKEKELGVFPPSPRWSVVGNPVLERNTNGNYIVKPEMVEFALQAKLWKERVERWKQDNEVP